MEQVFEATREPLMSAHQNSLNSRNNFVQEHRKRKSSTFDDVASTASSFEAVTLPQSPNHTTHTFQPISTVLRAHLPLSWLSGSSSHQLRPGTIIQAKISNISRWEYHILVVNLVPSCALFALEKIDNDTYISYPLQSWVRPQWVEQAAYGAAPTVDVGLLLRPQIDVSHSRKASNISLYGANEQQDLQCSPKVAQNRRGHLARLSIFEARSMTEEPLSLEEDRQRQTNPNPARPQEKPKETEHYEVGTEDTPVTPQTIGDVTTQSVQQSHLSDCVAAPVLAPADVQMIDHLATEHLQRQYLETLYLCKTSLAFYAKGPLSRARARARAPTTSRTSIGLAEFYLDHVLSTKKLDLKYKDSLPRKVTGFVAVGEEAVEQTAPGPRQSRRTKLGKDGLWPLEDEYIEKWWKSQDFVRTVANTAGNQSSELKMAISRLRTRETEMQIILILEILALEARDIPNQMDTDAKANPPVKVEPSEDGARDVLQQKPTSKRKRNLQSDLDFLVDRLCIWHSIGLEDVSAGNGNTPAAGLHSETWRDRLRDFCKDVIVPFYSAKLPVQCQSICAKMGGPELSPHRSKPYQKESTAQLPGMILAAERLPKKRNLQRVLSEDQSGRHVSPPVLSRSATLPIAPVTKREPSERPKSRSGMQKSVSFSNREVDLVADAKVTAAKRRKLDLVTAQKRELDAAIEALKKPNRSMIAKSFMDDVERRARDEKPVLRKEPVQITATPRRNRTTNMPDEDYDLPVMRSLTDRGDNATIPSSTIKPRGLSNISNMSRSSTKKRAVLSAIHDTPSKLAVVKIDPSSIPGTRDTCGERLRKEISSSTLIASTPTTSRLRTDLSDGIAATPLCMSRSLKPVLMTPMSKSEVNIEKAFRDVPEIPERAGRMMDRVMGSKTDLADVSLYDSLGWNDDYDL